jgi:hypothetical protein
VSVIVSECYSYPGTDLFNSLTSWPPGLVAPVQLLRNFGDTFANVVALVQIVRKCGDRCTEFVGHCIIKRTTIKKRVHTMLIVVVYNGGRVARTGVPSTGIRQYEKSVSIDGLLSSVV